jgi:hypothetical protein
VVVVDVETAGLRSAADGAQAVLSGVHGLILVGRQPITFAKVAFSVFRLDARSVLFFVCALILEVSLSISSLPLTCSFDSATPDLWPRPVLRLSPAITWDAVWTIFVELVKGL